MEKEKTLLKEAVYDGVGLHSGKKVHMVLKPAEAGTGIVFVRTDLPERPKIHARADLVTSTLRATTLSENGAEVFTVEHLLSALAMCAIDDCEIEMDSPEPPVADGCSLAFCEMIQKAGKKELGKERKVYTLDKPFSVYDGDKYIVALPYDGYRVSFTSINSHPMLGTQYFDIELTEASYMKEIAPARTIGFMQEVEQMKKMGLGLGGNTENAVIYDDEGCLSKLRFQDELVRHKILDVVGDLYLLGPMKCHIIAVKSGHAYNSQLAKKILAAREDTKMAITLDVNEIRQILPQRFPMLLVDRILDLEPMKWAIGVKNVTMGEMQFLGHFPDEPIMPGVLLIEAMAQVGGISMLYPKENRGKIALFGKIDKVRFRKPIVPGDQLITRAEVVKIHGNMGVIHCEGKVDGEVACECDCFFALHDPKDEKKKEKQS